MKNLTTLLFLFLFTQLLFNCKTEKKENATTEIKAGDSKEQTNTKTQDSALNTLAYIPIQKRISIKKGNPKNYTKHLLKDNENSFKVDTDRIHVEIPISSKNLKIIEVFNVSDYSKERKYNAIVIVLSDNTGSRSGKDVSHTIVSDLLISKIVGLNKDYLKQEGKLKVYIINDDSIGDKEKNVFKECAKQEKNYKSHMECNLVSSQLYEKDDDLKLDDVRKPSEQEGDIIPGE
jgi:hypothetical protein